MGFLRCLLSISIVFCASVCQGQSDDYFLHPTLLFDKEVKKMDAAFFCNSTKLEDRKKCIAISIVNNYLDNSFEEMHHNFDAFISLHESHELDELSIQVIFRYAKILDKLNEVETATRYFELINSVTEEGSLWHVLSRIYILGLSDNKIVINELVAQLDEMTIELTQKEKVIVVYIFARFLEEIELRELYKKYLSLVDGNISNSFRYYFLSRAYANFSFNHDEAANDVLKSLDSLVKADPDIKEEHIDYRVRSQVAMSHGDYRQALFNNWLEVESIIGEFCDVEELLSKYDESLLIPQNVITRYASRNLYQTRLGASIDVVKDSYQIYRHILQSNLGIRLTKLRNFSAINVDFSQIFYQNLLIVGNYLHQKTQDEIYLEESISILDGVIGMGAYFWAMARERMRKDTDFAHALNALLEAEASFREPDKDLSLREIFNQHERLRRQRSGFREQYADFYAELEKGYQLNFKDLRRELARDSSAVVCFYATSRMLYRFYISPDTMEVQILNQYLSEARTLTAQLNQQAPDVKQDQNELGDASHELYQILFSGFDSLLPAKLHIVATEEFIDVPFSALRKSPRGAPVRYLGTDHAISRQFSIGSMLRLAEQQRSPSFAQPLALAPSFEGELLDASELRQAGFALNPLLYNQEELQQLESLGGGKYLYGKRATIDRYHRAAPDYGIIHLASHAVSSQVNGVRSRVYLLDEEGVPQPLFAKDLERTTLNAELVVLSACETGGGGRNVVEGRVGLTKAYLGAGARAVVASSWAVDDYATSELMAVFYAATARGAAPHEAIRQARAAYLAKHPDAPVANWAAFEAYGGMVAPKWDLAEKRNWWLWGGGLAALFGLGLGATTLRRAA